jgi:predicted RecA/RadA family phage recombinase
MRNGLIHMTAGEDLAKGRLVKISGATVVYNDEADTTPIGVTMDAVESGAEISILRTNHEGTLDVCVLDGNLVTAGCTLYTSDDGKMATVNGGAATVRGIAIGGAAAANALVEVLFLV